MQTVGRIGSYISKSVYTVSGTFHPFGGAVDIIVVEQPDGSYKSSPWYVRFGKFQGVLKTKEKVVGIRVNDVEVDLHMHLDSKGEAFFLQEVDVEEGESEASPPSSSGEDMEGPPRWPLKSKSFNYDSNVYDPLSSERKALTRANSRQSQFFGFFGRRPPAEETVQGKENEPGVKDAGSLEAAEMAVDLLDLRWSTNLASSKHKKGNTSSLPPKDTLKQEFSKNSPVDCSSQDEISLISQTHCQELKSATEANGVAMKCVTSEYMVSTSVGSVGDNTSLSNSEPVMTTGALGLDKSDLLVSSVSVVSGVTKSDLDIQDSVEKLNGLPDANISTEENAKDNVLPFYSSKISGSSTVGLEGSFEEKNKLFCHEECRDICIHTEDQFTILHEEKISLSGGTFCGASESIVTESYSQLVCHHQSNDSLTDIDSQSNAAASTSSYSTCLPMDERNNLGDKDKPLCDPHIQRCISVPPRIEASKISGDELLVFSSLDQFGPSQAKHLELSQSDYEGKVAADSLFLSRVAGAGIKSSDAKCCSNFSVDQSDIHDCANDVGLDTKGLSSIYSNIHINEIGNVHSEGPIRTARSLPIMVDFCNNVEASCNKLEASDPDYFSHASPYPVLDSCPEKNCQFPGAQRKAELPAKQGYPPRSMDTLGGSERNGPILFRRSRGIKVSDVMNAGESLNSIDNPSKSSDMKKEMEVKKVKVNKKKVRILTPTSKQLASLNLKEGKNIVIFTFSTPMLGNQQVDARIFLWRWDAKIVISDVDGTITRSDLLGQVMPLVGMDWSQTGVAHLFTAIKENGYQLLFLSARSISQSYITRQFLLNIKQDGKALPEGPVVISPDGLVPSLFREVVRRAPHEFKISCLEDIKALFPPDRNPFYAGFGNRDTDEVSYLKVGIPMGKIFIINPKGEIAVNRRVDTKSYVTLHSLVHGMFPHTCTCEEEDFNSWNYWKLPPPSIDF